RLPSSRSSIPRDPWDPPSHGLPAPSFFGGGWRGRRSSVGLDHRLVRRSAQREGGSSPDATERQGGTEVAGRDGAVTAPMPATVLRINVKPGDAVKKGDVLVLLEAMKMELPVRATDDGVVATIRCREGELVDADAVLLEWQ